MNILVLGGNGYLGSKVIENLLSEGKHSITCTVRSTSDLSRIKKFADQGLSIIPASLDAVKTASIYTSFDAVFNMACSYGKKSTLYNNVIEANIDFPLQVLNCVVEKGCKHFYTIGTGLPDDMNMYSFSKKMFSEFGNYYASHHHIDFVDLKLQMFYGADEPKDRFIPQLIMKMINGEEVNVTVGTQRRDIVAVEDIISALMGIFHSDIHGYIEIPVGTGIAPSISELVDYIWEETGKKSIVNKGAVPMRDFEPDCVADTSRLKEIMDWNPVYWKNGISNMINRMEENL